MFIYIIYLVSDPILGNCSLVLEYADGGTLQNYLQNHIKELKWDDRFDLAFQIASAISCLHNHDIIHCDLVIINYLIYFFFITLRINELIKFYM